MSEHLPKLLFAFLTCMGCSSSSETAPRSSLEVTFGSNSAISVATTPATDGDVSRVLIRSAVAEATVLVSIQQPITPGHLEISTGNDAVYLWAKRGSEPPLIATSGAIDMTLLNGVLGLSVTVSKPADALSEMMTITGTVEDVQVPR